MRYIVSISGGKDSTAAWLHVTRELGIAADGVMADTGHESPLTYEYVSTLEREHGLSLTVVRGTMSQLRRDLPDNEPLTFEKLTVHRKRFPSTRARFCTTELKLRPVRAWLLAEMEAEPCAACGAEAGERCAGRRLTQKGPQPVCPDGRGATITQVVGTRAEESPARARMDPEPTYDEYTGTTVWRPIHHWTHAEVFACHARHDVPPNPLYLHGMGRVGCFPCIMANKAELRQIARRFPEAFDRVAEMEEATRANSKRGGSFWAADRTSQPYRSQLDETSGKRYSLAADVKAWALGAEPTAPGFQRSLPMFREEGEDMFGPACVSRYGLCE